MFDLISSHILVSLQLTPTPGEGVALHINSSSRHKTAGKMYYFLRLRYSNSHEKLE